MILTQSPVSQFPVLGSLRQIISSPPAPAVRVLCFFPFSYSRMTGLTHASALLSYEGVPERFPFLGLRSISTLFPFSSLTPIMLDQTQSDVTLNDFIFKEDIRRLCIKDITYFHLELWVSALRPFLAAIKW